jgi:hypothetical protein
MEERTQLDAYGDVSCLNCGVVFVLCASRLSLWCLLKLLVPNALAASTTSDVSGTRSATSRYPSSTHLSNLDRSSGGDCQKTQQAYTKKDSLACGNTFERF